MTPDKPRDPRDPRQAPGSPGSASTPGPRPSPAPAPGTGTGTTPRTDPATGSLTLKGIDPARMDTDGRVIAFALLISLAFHAAVFATVYARPLAAVDPALLKPEIEIIHFHRAASDAVADDYNGPPIIASNPEATAIKPPAPDEAVRQTLADDSNAQPTAVAPPQPSPMLQTPMPGPRTILAGPPDPGAAGGLRDRSQLGGSGDPNSPVGMAAGQAGLKGPRVDLPTALAQAPTINQGLEIHFNGPTTGNPALSINGGALVPGPGRGKSVAGTGAGGSGLARDVLADQSTVPGLSMGPPPLRPFQPDDTTAGITRPTPDAPMAPAPNVDIQPPTLIPATNLETPEHLDDDFDYLLSVVPPEDNSQGYLRVEFTPKRTLHRLKTMPKDVVFLFDTSLSIPQDWADTVGEGIRDSLSMLNPQDRFNIVLFNQAMQYFNEDGPVPATDANIAKALDFLAHPHAGGLTDINKAVSRLLVRDVSMERVYDIIFLSDGKPTEGVQDMRELLNLITRDNDLSASIYCVGVGVEPDHALLEFLAYRNKGFCVYVPSEKRAPAIIRDLMSRIRYPIIKGVRADAAGVDPAQVFPRDLPDIHQGENFSIYGRFDKPGPFTMRLSGRNGGKPVDLTFTRDLAQGERGDHHIPREWAFWKLFDLYSQVLSQGETPALKAQIDAIRKDYGIKTVY